MLEPTWDLPPGVYVDANRDDGAISKSAKLADLNADATSMNRRAVRSAQPNSASSQSPNCPWSNASTIDVINRTDAPVVAHLADVMRSFGVVVGDEVATVTLGPGERFTFYRGDRINAVVRCRR